MNNIGLFQFTEESRTRLTSLAELINEPIEDFVKKALYFISAKTFNETLINADKSILEGLKKYAGNPELLQSFYRANIPEVKIKEAFTSAHNFYIDKLISECGGNFSEETIQQINGLRF